MIYGVVCCLIGAGPLAPVSNLQIVPDGDPTRVVVRYLLPADAIAPPSGALDEQSGRKRLVFGLKGEAGSRPAPVFGAYEYRDGVLSFRPRFGLVRGSTYRAAALDVSSASEGKPLATADYSVPDVEAGPPTIVTAVKPAGDVLPANLLRIAIDFSRPMREGREVLERIHLFDDAGNELGAPWRDIELWNENAIRLSLYIHPGRIKQGVNLRDEFGPVLHPGRKYTLVIGADLRDARGIALGKEFRREFRTSEEVRSRIDTARWTLSSPEAGTRQALVIGFDRLIDAYLPLRCLTVNDADGRPVDGTIEVAADQRSCRFTPQSPWNSGEMELVIDPILEDVAGNTPVRAFDHDRTKVEATPPMLKRGFRVR